MNKQQAYLSRIVEGVENARHTLAVYNYRNLSTMNEYGSKILSKGKKKKKGRKKRCLVYAIFRECFLRNELTERCDVCFSLANKL